MSYLSIHFELESLTLPLFRQSVKARSHGVDQLLWTTLNVWTVWTSFSFNFSNHIFLTLNNCATNVPTSIPVKTNKMWLNILIKFNSDDVWKVQFRENNSIGKPLYQMNGQIYLFLFIKLGSTHVKLIKRKATLYTGTKKLSKFKLRIPYIMMLTILVDSNNIRL